MRADWDTWHGRGFGGGRGGSRAGRGAWDSGGRGRAEGRGFEGMARGRGDGSQPSWRFNALAYADGIAIMNGDQNKNPGVTAHLKEGDEDDTASSPSKTVVTGNVAATSSESVTKRQLELDEQQEGILPGDQSGNVPMITDGAAEPGLGLADVPMLEGNESPQGLLKDATDNERTKRSKRDGANSSSLGSAGSLEEPVRSQ